MWIEIEKKKGDNCALYLAVKRKEGGGGGKIQPPTTI